MPITSKWWNVLNSGFSGNMSDSVPEVSKSIIVVLARTYNHSLTAVVGAGYTNMYLPITSTTQSPSSLSDLS